MRYHDLVDIAIVAVPYANDVARWGMARGPEALLQRLVPALQAAGHQVAPPVWIELPREERTRDIVTNLGRLGGRTANAVQYALGQGKRVIVLEGNCTHAVGAAGGLARHAGTAGVIWFDAHGDLNTMETTETGLWGGMPYAVILGLDLDDWRMAAGLAQPVRGNAALLIGGSDLDAAEVAVLERLQMGRLDATQMQGADTAESLAALLQPRTASVPAWYLHLDLDVAGPEIVPGALTPAPNWPPRERLIEAAAAVARTVPVQVLGLAAYEPAGDGEGLGAAFATEFALAVYPS